MRPAPARSSHPSWRRTSPPPRAAPSRPRASATPRAASSPMRVRRSSASPTVSRPARGAPRRRSRPAGRPARRARSAGPARRSRAATASTVVGGVAVAAGEALVGRLGHALHARQAGGVDRLAQRDLVRAARRRARLALDEAVDGQLRHPPPGRQLAAGDGDHPAGGLVELGLARDVDRLLRVAGGDQRSHAGVGARDVLAAERGAEVGVDRAQQVGDVAPRRAGRGRGRRRRTRCRSCRRASTPATAARRSRARRRRGRSPPPPAGASRGRA